MKLEQLKKMIREVAKKEMLKEEEINWNAVQNAIINFLKTNTKILDKKVQSKDTEGVKNGLKSILSGLTNAQRSLKLESASRTAMEIGGLTGLNKDAVQKFVDTHNLDIEKVFQFVKKGKLSDRMDFVTAVSGKPNNPIQKKLIKKLQESVNEATNLAKMMAGIKKGSQTGPWTIVVSFNKKVYYQTQVKTKNEIPAKFEHMKKVTNIPGYIFTIEDNTGMTVYSEKLLNEARKYELKVAKTGKYEIRYITDDLGTNIYSVFLDGLQFGNEYDGEGGVFATDSRVSIKNIEKLLNKFRNSIKESVNEGKYDADLDKIEAVVKNASSFMNVGSELKKAGIKYDFSTEMIPMYIIKVSGNTIAIVNKKYAAGAEREVGNYAIVLMKFQNLVKEAKKYDIGSGYLGNGLTIWNRAEEKDGDYETIAHIGKDGKLTIYDKEIPADIKKMIGIWATSMKKGNRPGSY